MPGLKKYLFISKNTYLNSISDPGKFYSFIIGHTATVIMLVVFWGAVFRVYPNFKGYTYNTMILYYLAITLLNRILGTGVSAKAIQEQVSKGSLSFRLLNPISWNIRTFLAGITSRVASSVSGLVIFVLITIFLNNNFSTDPIRILLFFLALILAVILNYYLYAIIGVLSFYTIENWGYRAIFGRIADLAGGKVFPLDMLPTSLIDTFTFLPFSYSLFFVLQIYLNKVSINQILQGLPVQLSWCVVVILVYTALFNKGIKHYESVGS